MLRRSMEGVNMTDVTGGQAVGKSERGVIPDPKKRVRHKVNGDG